MLNYLTSSYIRTSVQHLLYVSANVALYMWEDITFLCPDVTYDGDMVVIGNSELPLFLHVGQFNSAVYETSLASSAVADAILLWRCYIVWGRQHKIIVLPALLYPAAHVVGLVLTLTDVWIHINLQLSQSAGYALAACVIGLNNLLLSTLIGMLKCLAYVSTLLNLLKAYHIFWISHQVVTYLGPKSRNMYQTIIAVTLESGLLYAAFLITFFILGIVQVVEGTGNDRLTLFYYIYGQTWAPIAGIVSTIIIVRVTLGISLDSVESTIISINAANTQNEEAHVIDISPSTNA
ncbi:hypothetical protein Moror_2144 [Moniliophthora roreri MCA 2997]|uniref:Uncharacterized protein n=1 Tax=Moniliophthora roreri (strain MCA 2997) TaxID=1381753 RepID=V2WT29_MONRO|nr:hypothetical protein Moror_2144 [Moniliophthora roreri MCA 2997]